MSARSVEVYEIESECITVSILSSSCSQEILYRGQNVKEQSFPYYWYGLKVRIGSNSSSFPNKPIKIQ